MNSIHTVGDIRAAIERLSDDTPVEGLGEGEPFTDIYFSFDENKQTLYIECDD